MTALQLLDSRAAAFAIAPCPEGKSPPSLACNGST